MKSLLSTEEKKKLADDNKYQVLKIFDGEQWVYLLAADPIPERSKNWEHVIQTIIGTDLSLSEERLKDLKSDCENLYGKDSETYAKINWHVKESHKEA